MRWDESRLNLCVTYPDDSTAAWGANEHCLTAKPQTPVRYVTDLFWAERLIREHMWYARGNGEYAVVSEDYIALSEALAHYIATYADGEDVGKRVDLDSPLSELASLHLKLWRNVPNDK